MYCTRILKIEMIVNFCFEETGSVAAICRKGNHAHMDETEMTWGQG